MRSWGGGQRMTQAQKERERNKDHEDEGNVKHLWHGGNREGAVGGGDTDESFHTSQQKTQHQARCQLQSVWNCFLSPLLFFLSPQNFCFLNQKSKKKNIQRKKQLPASPLHWLGFQRLKGTLLFCLWFAGTLFQWWNSNRNTHTAKKW